MDFRVQGQPGEFQDNQGYTEKPCLEKTKQNKRKKRKERKEKKRKEKKRKKRKERKERERGKSLKRELRKRGGAKQPLI